VAVLTPGCIGSNSLETLTVMLFRTPEACGRLHPASPHDVTNALHHV
jgi:hypothetical protein